MSPSRCSIRRKTSFWCVEFNFGMKYAFNLFTAFSYSAAVPVSASLEDLVLALVGEVELSVVLYCQLCLLE